MDSNSENRKKSAKINLKLILGSAIGICFFMLPFKWNGEITIPLSFAKNLISFPIKPYLPAVIMIITILSFIMSVIMKFKGDEKGSKYIRDLFVVSNMTIAIRILAAIVTILTYFKVGPEQIWNEYTGGLIVNTLMPSLLILFLLASAMLPLLTEYGAMELIGGVVQPIFKPLFKIPGRAAILALSSWFGSGTIGILTTDEQYKKGNFTGRESAIICMGFATITLPSVFIYTTSIAGLNVSTFSYFFLTLIIVTVVSTMIISRIPPLSKIPDEHYKGEGQGIHEEAKSELTAYEQAYKKAEVAPDVATMFKNGIMTSFRLYMNVFPLIIFLATIVLMITEYTPLFSIIAAPLVPILNLIGIPEAATVAPAFLTGFADLLLPFLAATSIKSQLAKFIVCIVATIQVICMSETGAVLLKSEIPVKFHTLVFVFLEKTVIAVIVALIMGRLIGLA